MFLLLSSTTWTMNMNTMVVVGAGTMRRGIARLAATKGTNVHLIDERYELPDRSMGGR